MSEHAGMRGFVGTGGFPTHASVQLNKPGQTYFGFGPKVMSPIYTSKRSPDERSDIRGLSTFLIAHALVRATPHD